MNLFKSKFYKKNIGKDFKSLLFLHTTYYKEE